MNNKIVLASLAMDLKRVAIGYHRGSKKMGERFWQEALKRKDEINVESMKPYVRTLLSKFPTLKNQKDDIEIAEDALTYSILFQNAAGKSK